MNISQVYALALGSILTVLLTYRLAASLSHLVRVPIISFFLKHILYPFVSRRFRYLGPITRLELLLQACYWGGTVACNVIGIHTVAQAGSRAGTLSLINIIPLLFAGQLGFAADLIGVSLRAYVQLHGSLGLMTFVQGLTHVLISINLSSFTVKDALHLYGLLVYTLFYVSQ